MATALVRRCQSRLEGHEYQDSLDSRSVVEGAVIVAVLYLSILLAVPVAQELSIC